MSVIPTTEIIIHEKMVWEFLIKLNQYLPHDPAVQLQGVYPREIKGWSTKDIQMIIAALVIIAPNWKQPRCPSTGKQKTV